MTLLAAAGSLEGQGKLNRLRTPVGARISKSLYRPSSNVSTSAPPQEASDAISGWGAAAPLFLQDIQASSGGLASLVLSISCTSSNTMPERDDNRHFIAKRAVVLLGRGLASCWHPT